MKKILYILLLCSTATATLFAQNIGMKNNIVTLDNQNYLVWNGGLTKVSVCIPKGTEIAFLQLDNTRKSYDVLFADGSRAYWTPEPLTTTSKNFAKDMYNAGVLLADGTVNAQALALFVQQHPATNPNVVFERPEQPLTQTVGGMADRDKSKPISLQNYEIYQDGVLIGKYTAETQMINEIKLNTFTFSFPNGNMVAQARFFDKTTAIGVMTVKDSGRGTIEITSPNYLQDIIKYLVDNGHL